MVREQLHLWDAMLSWAISFNLIHLICIFLYHTGLSQEVDKSVRREPLSCRWTTAWLLLRYGQYSYELRFWIRFLMIWIIRSESRLDWKSVLPPISFQSVSFFDGPHYPSLHWLSYWVKPCLRKKVYIGIIKAICVPLKIMIIIKILILLTIILVIMTTSFKQNLKYSISRLVSYNFILIHIRS